MNFITRRPICRVIFHFIYTSIDLMGNKVLIIYCEAAHKLRLKTVNRTTFKFQ